MTPSTYSAQTKTRWTTRGRTWGSPPCYQRKVLRVWVIVIGPVISPKSSRVHKKVPRPKPNYKLKSPGTALGLFQNTDLSITVLYLVVLAWLLSESDSVSLWLLLVWCRVPEDQLLNYSCWSGAKISLARPHGSPPSLPTRHRVTEMGSRLVN